MKDYVFHTGYLFQITWMVRCDLYCDDEAARKYNLHIVP